MNQAAGKVLVTGAGGFIGKQLCRALSEQGIHTNVLLRTQGEDQNKNPTDPLPATVTRFIGDIGDVAVLEQAMAGVETVFHLAGIAHVDELDKSRLQAVNIDGTIAVIKAARASGVSRIVYFSSSLAHAVQYQHSEVTEYGRSKYQAEQLLRQAGQDSPIQVCILRPVNVYGAGMKGNIMGMIRMISRGRMPPLPRLQTRLSLVGVTDLCQAAILVAGSEVAAGKTYYVTDGIDYAINDIEEAIYQAVGRQKSRWRCPRVILYAGAATVGMLNRLAGRRSSISARTYRNLARDNVFSNSRLVEESGFRPATTFYNELPIIVAAGIADKTRQTKK